MGEQRDEHGSVGDDTLNDLAGAGRDDYLTADRVAGIDDASGIDAPVSDGQEDSPDQSENPEASTYGAP